MTSTVMDTRLSQLLADPNGNHWTQATHRVPSLNNAQSDLVMRLLAFGEQYKHIFGLLSGIQKKETVNVTAGGYALSGLTGTIMQNGYVNSSVLLDDVTKYPTKIDADQLGLTKNFFFRGTNISPKCYIWESKYYLLVDTGSFPVSTTFYYIRESATIAVGSQDSELNVIMHNLIIKMAMVRCYSMRSAQTDLARIQQLEKEINIDIMSLVRGDKFEPKSDGEAGQSLRESKQGVSQNAES